MKNLILFAVAWLSFQASASSIVYQGSEFSGAACSLTIVNADKSGIEGGWSSFQLLVNTSYQLADSAPVLTKPSPQAWSYFGKSETNYDEIAIDFNFDQKPTWDSLRAYTFQTWDKARGLVQARCKDLKRQQ